MMTSTFVHSLLSGAVAGFATDVALYPIDTVKTRLQSAEGFIKSGGFRGIYRGLLATSVASAPTAALFFSTYDTSKKRLESILGVGSPVAHMASASLGEIVACLVRVPTENIKQKQQTGITGSITNTVKLIRNNQGFRGFYTGYNTTCFRDVPFALIQFPLWEYLKTKFADESGNCTTTQSAICGSFAGAIAAGLTTPLDVAKTRQMLDHTGKRYGGQGMIYVLQTIRGNEGYRALFSGVQPRVIWISIGGFFFFGTYVCFIFLQIRFFFRTEFCT